MKKYFKHYFGFILLFLCTSIYSQNLDLSKSTLSLTGDTGSMITPLLQIKNISSNNVQIFVTRIQKNLPANWTVCFCYIVCNPPELDTLRINLVPGETVIIGNGFHTDSVRGTGSIKVAVEEVNGTQKDTLTFTASTLAAGVKEMLNEDSFTAFPNPCNEQFTFTQKTGSELTLQLFSPNGSSIKEYKIKQAEPLIINTDSFAPGNYFLKITNTSGQSTLKKLIIQH